ASLQIAGGPFCVTARFRAEADGVLLARGGHNLGYVLYVADGRPCFAVRVAPDTLLIAEGRDPCLGRECVVCAHAGDGTVSLRIDDSPPEMLSVGDSTIPRDPTEAMEIGIDAGTAVAAGYAAGGFRGRLYDIALFDRVPTAAELAAVQSGTR
ncbi:MAG: hypothetical protein JXB13_14400, partial [Phycisphaerae bacterium]|nr:hypothetical protein [Phycisphaerae bacterium]